MKSVELNGEIFHYDQEQSILRFHIRKPFFSAGKKFHWKGVTVGLGISKAALDFALMNHLTKIQVTVGDSPKIYETDTATWLNFANAANSKMVKGQTELYIIQWSNDHFRKLDPKEQQKI